MQQALLPGLCGCVVCCCPGQQHQALPQVLCCLEHPGPWVCPCCCLLVEPCLPLSHLCWYGVGLGHVLPGLITIRGLEGRTQAPLQTENEQTSNAGQGVIGAQAQGPGREGGAAARCNNRAALVACLLLGSAHCCCCEVAEVPALLCQLLGGKPGGTITAECCCVAPQALLPTFFVRLYSPGTADTSCPALRPGTALSAERAGLHNRSQSEARWKPRGPDTGAVLGYPPVRTPPAGLC